MHKIFNLISNWFAPLFEAAPLDDPLASMSARELADLPVHHPRIS